MRQLYYRQLPHMRSFPGFGIVYSMGFMDVSVGQQVGVYAILYILISNKMGGTTKGVVVAFIVVLAIALACGAFNGAVAVWLGLPSIVTSLFLMFFFTGAQLLLMEGTGNTSISIQAKIKLWTGTSTRSC